MKIIRSSLTALAFTALIAVPVEAQRCVGFPTVGGQSAVALTFNTLTGGNQYGVEGNANLSGDFGVFAGFAVSDPDDEDLDGTTSFGIGGAFFSDRLSGAIGRQLSVCPTASIVFADADNRDIYSIPVGIGFARSFELGEPGGMMLHPYVLPQIAFQHLDGDNDTDFQISLGANVNFMESFYFGGSVNRVFVEGADSQFGLRLGLVF